MNLANIKLLALDVDGILTDGRVWFDGQGEQLKPFHTQDGLGIKLLLEAGIEVAIITGRISPMVDYRARQLGIMHVIQGRDDKLSALKSLLEHLELDLAQTAYMGDDLPDLSALLAVNAGFTVPGADPWVAERIQATIRPGGAGAVREVCNQILDAQGLKAKALQQHGVAE